MKEAYTITLKDYTRTIEKDKEHSLVFLYIDNLLREIDSINETLCEIQNKNKE